ncbi:hypothetical protein AWB75_01552 [Caballeronia catudaia]|uniref:Uncharacterized protein n=1 Tax=Caballeronia catudaia TaxID=1777136 RepID=A0A158A0L7_9BURK|nr:hypothetical protein AWB75_01552 [Caballeronia catudaia]
MLVAVLFVCPIGVAALFGFALVADRHFRDSISVPSQRTRPTKVIDHAAPGRV